MSLLNDIERQQAKDGWLKIVDSKAFAHMQLLVTEQLANEMLEATNPVKREEIAAEYRFSHKVYDIMITIANEMRKE